MEFAFTFILILNKLPLKVLFLLLLLQIPLQLGAQQLPDSIVIGFSMHRHSLSKELEHSAVYTIVRKGKNYSFQDRKISGSDIRELLAAINEAVNTELSPSMFDSGELNKNPAELVKSYRDEPELSWNNEQKAFIFPILKDPANFRDALQEYLSEGNNTSFHFPFVKQYKLTFYSDGKKVNEITSGAFVHGYMLPWVNEKGDSLYHFEIEASLNRILELDGIEQEPLSGEKLMEKLAADIIENNMRSLYKLSAFSYLAEIDELQTDFTIFSHEEVYGRGRYIWDEPKTMKIILHTEQMLQNVNMIFMASTKNGTIYSRDSIKTEAPEIVSRIQSVAFITGFLKENPQTILNIYYFNNNGINEYSIAGVNKNPEEWKKYDKWLEGMKRYDTLAIKPSYADENARNTSEKIYCGCNYRFERAFIEKAVFFEITDDKRNSSIWFLLPDNTVLMYIMDSDQTLNFKRTDFDTKKEGGLIYPCARFDLDGNRILK